MKDFFDIWLMSRQFDFDGPLLVRAITSTFQNVSGARTPSLIGCSRGAGSRADGGHEGDLAEAGSELAGQRANGRGVQRPAGIRADHSSLVVVTARARVG
jgi:hypothetical protein